MNRFTKIAEWYLKRPNPVVCVTWLHGMSGRTGWKSDGNRFVAVIIRTFNLNYSSWRWHTNKRAFNWSSTFHADRRERTLSWQCFIIGHSCAAVVIPFSSFEKLNIFRIIMLVFRSNYYQRKYLSPFHDEWNCSSTTLICRTHQCWPSSILFHQEVQW